MAVTAGCSRLPFVSWGCGVAHNADFVNQYLDEISRLGGAKPPDSYRPEGWPGERFKDGGTAYKNGWELAWAEFGERRGVAMPLTEKVVKRLRPTGVQIQDSWDTLATAVGP